MSISARDGKGALPEDDGMGPLRQRINGCLGWIGDRCREIPSHSHTYDGEISLGSVSVCVGHRRRTTTNKDSHARTSTLTYVIGFRHQS